MPDVHYPETKFNIFSGMLKSIETEDGRKMVRTTASSTVIDHAGHGITEKAINSMAASAVGMTIFLNHKYSVPEDVFGVVETATAVKRGDVLDLDFDIAVDEDNPRAVATTKSLNRGVKLGTSIGCLVKDSWKEDGHLVIDDVTLLEASIVGIPANPRSWTQYVTKALAEATGVPEGEIAPEEAEPVAEAVEASPDPVLNEAEPDALNAETPPVAQEGQPTVPESAESDGASPVSTKEIASDEEEDSEEEPAEEEAEAEVEASIDDVSVKQADLTTLVKMVQTTTHEVVETRKALTEARLTIKALEQERDEAVANVVLAKQFVDRISELPIGRRASHAAAITEFRDRFSGIYDPEFLKMLTTKGD